MIRLLLLLCLWATSAFGQSPFPTVVSTGSAKISVSSATTTELVPLVSGQAISVTSFSIVAAGTGNIKFVYGTGTACATGTTDLTGDYNLTAQTGVSLGSGVAPVLILPPGKALCVTTSAAVGMYGLVSYSRF